MLKILQKHMHIFMYSVHCDYLIKTKIAKFQ